MSTAVRSGCAALLAAAACLGAAGCIRWNGESKTVSGSEFLSLAERYESYGGPSPLGTNRPHWAYGGEDSRYYYAEHWALKSASWVEYDSSIRAPKSEMPDWRPPERGTWLVPRR